MFHCCVRVVRSLVFCVVFCRSLFVILSFFLLAILLSVLLRFKTSDYPFGILKRFLWCQEGKNTYIRHWSYYVKSWQTLQFLWHYVGIHWTILCYINFIWWWIVTYRLLYISNILCIFRYNGVISDHQWLRRDFF